MGSDGERSICRFSSSNSETPVGCVSSLPTHIPCTSWHSIRTTHGRQGTSAIATHTRSLSDTQLRTSAQHNPAHTSPLQRRPLLRSRSAVVPPPAARSSSMLARDAAGRPAVNQARTAASRTTLACGAALPTHKRGQALTATFGTRDFAQQHAAANGSLGYCRTAAHVPGHTRKRSTIITGRFALVLRGNCISRTQTHTPHSKNTANTSPL